MDVVSRRCIEIDDAPRIARTNRNLFHVNIWRVEQIAFFGDGNNSQRIRQVLGADRRAFQRIESDINVRPLFGADFFADIKHRRFIAFAFTDHDRASNRKAIQFLTHGINGSLISSHFIATSTKACCSHCRAFGHTNEFQCENAIQSVRLLFCSLGHVNKVLNSNYVDAFV